MSKIYTSEPDHLWLHNFYDCKVCFEGKIYHSAEAAWEASKTDNKNIRDMFTHLTAYQAYKTGEQLTPKPEWYDKQNQIIYEILYSKFHDNYDLFDKLIATDPDEIISMDGYDDEYWSINHRTRHGQNMLGLLLMDLRKDCMDQLQDYYMTNSYNYVP